MILGFDIGGTKLRAGLFDRSGALTRDDRVLVPQQGGADRFLAEVSRLGKSICGKDSITSIGVATAGPVDLLTGELHCPTNLQHTAGGDWSSIPLLGHLAQEFNVPVFIDNDAAAATLAEAQLGAGRGMDRFALFAIGTGLGTGFWHDGAVLRASLRDHTEVGHMIIAPHMTSHRCGCGNFGCAEAVLSGVNFPKALGAPHGIGDISGAAIAEMARANDQRALKVFEQYGQYLAQLINNIVLLLGSRCIVLTGSVAEARDCFLPATQTHLAALLRDKSALIPEIVYSTLGADAMLQGSYLVARRGLVPG